ncbi:MAG: T9SS type A sorting domain-containing protein [Bacteroidetes bacterium]|nr:T9SS type A sorting domain-containing protein [Bacteroidota bacterium]
MAKAQTVYYPAQASQLLKATAEDAASLLQQSIPGSHFVTQSYTNIPSAGIVFIYDATISDNQACKVACDGHSYIRFSAYSDNGLHFGLYQYLHQLGFRFYQPGSIWEIIPSMNTAYQKTDTTFTCSYIYKTWFISGGHNRWVMDNNPAYSWDNYFGDNGHNWALYQRRNGMMGASRFTGHRDDMMNGTYMTALQNNPCYVANYNGSRQANYQSVPDIFNPAAKELWATSLEQKYTQYQNNIFTNSTLYTNIYRNYRYNYDYIGLEVPDGAKFGNSKDNETCTAEDYPKESDQHFTLANYVAESLLGKYPGKRFQLYAYSGHADVPSANISINNNIDVQLIPTVYQMESSTNGLRNRWYNRYSNVSEYLYLNLSNWSGETPAFKWSDIKAALQIAKDKKSQGVMWEASPAKFGSLPVLLAANSFLKDNIEVDSTLHEFCNNMFGAASTTIYKLVTLWGEEETLPDRYTIPSYIRLLQTADQQTQNAPAVVKERLRELKAYLHYMVLYYNLANNDQDKSGSKADRDGALCIYLAKTNKMQLVNSYYMIATIVSKYGNTSDFYTKYNVVNGTAYQGGALPLLSAAEADNNFQQDVSLYAGKQDQFAILTPAYVQQQFKAGNIAPLAKINAKIMYTNGINYYNKTTFNIVAPSAGSFSVQYTPTFDMAGKGYINFEVESADKALQVVKDFSIDNTSKGGTFKVDLPQAGNYVLTIVSKYKSSVNISITTNGNYFYKSGQFLGNKTESYRDDISSLPGYFYIPAGIDKIYCNVSSYSDGKYATEEAINKVFAIKDQNGKAVQLHYADATDSSLMVLDIPGGAAGTFWQVTNMAQYNMQFVNISNSLWTASRLSCSASVFGISVINKNGTCITRLTTTAPAQGLTWQVTDATSKLQYSNQSVIDLPANISANATITLTNAGGCTYSRVLADDKNYLDDKESCAGGVAVAQVTMYPNPSTGIFNCMQNGSIAMADEINVYNTQGTLVGSFKNTRQFNITSATPGMYLYRAVINGQVQQGKVVKL